MRGYLTALVVCALTVGTIGYLLRSRRIREKYAASWIALAVAVVTVGAVPSVLTWLATLLGVQTPVNLLFLVSGVVLLIVCVQFSVEISQLEEETRTLAEEIALLRLDLEDVRSQIPQQGAADPDARPSGAPPA
ncbi:DUF2304 domain-containing protein [Cellulomonas iranensis]|uniref:DUF2304 domain-containing protein n=1 Tax=Cellulomonas iranensis TaxID=76862 RepID=A0ABU0GMB3_9CELL|nr:DUF2304 domain-containing protein [Cellulomonas iranensis]MDQ0426499.1 hypothetical protein [Cellulomonas iranensis]UCN15900.1 DUF2304 domain-containing protein [Cellulomonas iranensis]